MSRHLRLVDPPRYETSYVVARSRHVSPGGPYVVAACADRAVAELLSLSGHEIHGLDEMRRRPDLAEALRAWEADDHGLHRAERSAALAFARSVTGGPSRSVHPSVLGKLLP